MRSRNSILLAIIAIVALVAIYVDLPNSPGLHIRALGLNLDFRILQGLDLQGGLQVLLEADLPEEERIEPETLRQMATIIDNRVNALGVTEPLVQTQGARRIIVELPGIEDPDAAIATLRETGLLEFVDAGNTYLAPGTVIETTYPRLLSEGATGGLITPEGSDEPVQIFPTVLTGSYLRSASAYRDPTTGVFGIQFELTAEGAQIFSDFTTANADYDRQPFYYLSIVLDRTVISSPHIRSPIPEGQGVIEGNFTLQEAQNLAIQLRYGALPIPLRVETVRSIGPSLGQDSVARSIRAGAVGLSIVLLFMLVYYRLPGLLADMALVLYGLLNLAVYKAGWPVLLIVGLLLMISYLFDRRETWALILGGMMLAGSAALGIANFTGVVLTLPAITGFILSTGMAVDANILVFERMKEEVRAGRTMNSALEAGFSRAWTSIRDSNISTLITCSILFYFGSAFGAGAVRGFAITLALGVVINLFTAIIVTRTLLRVLYDWQGEKLRTSRLMVSV